MSNMQIQERVLELVASLENYARMTRFEIKHSGPCAIDCANVTVSLATELATLLGKGRLEVSRG